MVRCRSLCKTGRIQAAAPVAIQRGWTNANSNHHRSNFMYKSLITAVSATALILGTANLASAQDKTTTDKTAPTTRSMSSDKSATDMQKKQDGIRNDSSMKGTKSTGTHSTSAGAESYKSYGDNKVSYKNAKLSGKHSADDLVGADLNNAAGDEIGEIEDLLVGPNNDVTLAVVEVGGFLGMGSKYVALELEKINKLNDGDYTIAMTKEQLESLPPLHKENGLWAHGAK